MKVKITPTGESAQVMEFNVSLPCGANASIAPVSTLTVKAEMKEKAADGFVVNILNKPVRFGEDDVNQLVEIFKTFKQNN